MQRAQDMHAAGTQAADDIWVVCGTHEMHAVRVPCLPQHIDQAATTVHWVVADNVDDSVSWREGDDMARKECMGHGGVKICGLLHAL
jgi:hypothetical protein